MNTVTPVVVSIYGVERELRFTHGAVKRIHEQFGMGAKEALNAYDVGALPGILYALMHDRKGKPPEGVDVAELAEALPVEDAPIYMAAVQSAMMQGRVPKDQLEVAIRQKLQKLQEEAEKEIARLTGSPSGHSAADVSVSPTASSGGDTASVKLTPSPSNTETSSESGTHDSD
jgi:hypothetical protein